MNTADENLLILFTASWFKTSIAKMVRKCYNYIGPREAAGPVIFMLRKHGLQRKKTIL